MQSISIHIYDMLLRYMVKLWDILFLCVAESHSDPLQYYMIWSWRFNGLVWIPMMQRKSVGFCCVSVADLEICRDKSLLVQGPGPLSGYKLDRSVVVPSTTVYQLPAFETPNCFENSAALLAVFFEGMASDLIGSSRLLADVQLATKRRRVKP